MVFRLNCSCKNQVWGGLGHWFHLLTLIRQTLDWGSKFCMLISISRSFIGGYTNVNRMGRQILASVHYFNVLHWLCCEFFIKIDSRNGSDSFSEMDTDLSSLFLPHFLPFFICNHPSGQHVLLLIMRSRFRSPALPQILNVDWSGTGSTQPREDNWVATWLRSSGSD